MNTEKIASKIKNDKKIIFVILIGLVGVIVLLFSGTSDETLPAENNIDGNSAVNSSLCVLSACETEKLLAEKVENLVSQLAGAGEVKAEVTVSSSCECVYAENVRTESDSHNSSEDREFVIYSDDTEDGLLICVKNPEILGVAVICQGADSSVVTAQVTQLVTHLFGIGSDKVYVGKKI